ncbi:MAG: peptide deformylase [Chitinophagales bacterium]|nr:peptide deformylase [Chitinophagales bacterium]MDW8393747.1 peptide deformylase [Chitinophagales bacterium]
MILPIVAYGDPVLRRKADPITAAYPQLQQLIDDMFETMYAASGIGLAAPQVGHSIRLFVVDTAAALKTRAANEGADQESAFANEKPVRRVIINAEVIEKNGTPWQYNEGCLSIPTIREDIGRPETIRIRYLDEQFRPQEEMFQGLAGRVVQHEYDHIEGILFIDYLRPLRRKLLQKKLSNISRGLVDVDYPMRFAKK